MFKYPFTFVDEPIKEDERKKDKYLKDKIKNDEELLTAFVYLYIKYGSEAHNDNILNIPLTVKNTTNKALELMDDLQDFVNTYIDITDNDKDFILRCNSNEKYNLHIKRTKGVNKSPQIANDEMKKKGFNSTNVNINGSGYDIYKGIKFKEDTLIALEKEKELDED